MHLRYYDEHKRLVMNEVDKFFSRVREPSAGSGRNAWSVATKNEYLNSYRIYMIINTFLMMYSHLEECLALRVIDVKGHAGTGLERFKGRYKDRYSINIDERHIGPSCKSAQTSQTRFSMPLEYHSRQKQNRTYFCN